MWKRKFCQLLLFDKKPYGLWAKDLSIWFHFFLLLLLLSPFMYSSQQSIRLAVSPFDNCQLIISNCFSNNSVRCVSTFIGKSRLIVYELLIRLGNATSHAELPHEYLIVWLSINTDYVTRYSSAPGSFPITWFQEWKRQQTPGNNTTKIYIYIYLTHAHKKGKR